MHWTGGGFRWLVRIALATGLVVTNILLARNVLTRAAKYEGFEMVKKAGKPIGDGVQTYLVLQLLPITRRVGIGGTIWSFDEAVAFHRWLGRITVVICAAHALAFVPRYIEKGELAVKLLRPKTFAGVVGLCALLCIACLSRDSVRRKHYRLFYVGHTMLGVLVFGTALLHYKPGHLLLKLFVPLALYSVDWAWRAILIHRRRNTVVDCRMLSDYSAAHLRLCVEPPLYHSPGQYVLIRCPEISQTSSLRALDQGFQWHPFSIASCAGDADVSLFIKPESKWTAAVAKWIEKKTARGGSDIRYASASALESQQLLARPTVQIDGPYGELWRKASESAKPRLLVLAAGIGITPCASIAVAAHKAGRRVRLVWTTRSLPSVEEFLPMLQLLGGCAEVSTSSTPRAAVSTPSTPMLQQLGPSSGIVEWHCRRAPMLRQAQILACAQLRRAHYDEPSERMQGQVFFTRAGVDGADWAIGVRFTLGRADIDQARHAAHVPPTPAAQSLCNLASPRSREPQPSVSSRELTVVPADNR
jgi:predicted ferric reductase